ncbi:hypothetical protein Psuf_054350 [Phytohabitans suffuscus]|uniref:DDE Tnp4 domain-containing protein n=1 Tax=Phytohabitans suffuscus TaxID=624315 RepID=A0A6F8YPS2_9ACTN|nr:hypothetical protein Psuf_054350 [Phytohabitans suffuscus]
MWIYDRLPGSTHDLTAARHHGVITTAYGADVEYRPTRASRRLRDRDRPHRNGCELAEARKVRCCPQRVGTLPETVPTLELGRE